jgi:hypothetical protein
VALPVTVSGVSRMREFAARLQAESEEAVLRDVMDEVADSAPPVLAEVKARVLAAEFPAIPSKGGGGSTGLRAHLAASTVVKRFTATVRFVVADPNGQKMARYTNGLALHTRWRHPVYGNRNAWVQQKADPWFYPPIEAAKPRFRAAVERGVDKFVRRVTG